MWIWGFTSPFNRDSKIKWLNRSPSILFSGVSCEKLRHAIGQQGSFFQKHTTSSQPATRNRVSTARICVVFDVCTRKLNIRCPNGLGVFHSNPFSRIELDEATWFRGKFRTKFEKVPYSTCFLPETEVETVTKVVRFESCNFVYML